MVTIGIQASFQFIPRFYINLTMVVDHDYHRMWKKSQSRSSKLNAFPFSRPALPPISIWEADHLGKKGKLKFQGGFDAWLDAALRIIPLSEAAANFEVAREASRVQLAEADIGDVFLAATASVFGLTVLTADAQLLGCRWLKTLPNR
jgi:PIN domain nuclease of toxin-antitoxin system